MVTRKELIVRPDQPEQQHLSEIARRTPQGLPEISWEFDPEQLQRAFPPLSAASQSRPTSVTTIIINGDYYSGNADKKARKRQRQLQLDNERRDREDRKERFDRRDSFIHLFGFLGYMAIMLIIGAMVFVLAMLGMVRHF